MTQEKKQLIEELTALIERDRAKLAELQEKYEEQEHNPQGQNLIARQISEVVKRLDRNENLRDKVKD